MALPDLIEIVPLTKPVRAEITVPGSKSITNRALMLAAFADGETTLQGALWSEDTQIMADCLQELGFTVTLKPDPAEFCNRIITVRGLGGRIPKSGTADKPLDLFVGNAGTAARFLSAFVCLGSGVYRLHGTPRMHERPQAALFQALRELGYRVDSENEDDKLPARIFGEASLSRRRRGGESLTENEDQRLLTPSPTTERRRSCTVSIEQSSQFASALLLCAEVGGWNVEVVGENAEESPYVAMTSKMIEAFPKKGGTFQIEPDASSGSYFWAVGLVLRSPASEIPASDRERPTHIMANVAKLSAKLPRLNRILEEVQREPSLSSIHYQWWKRIPEAIAEIDRPLAEWLMRMRDSRTEVLVAHWPQSGWQIDEEFTKYLLPTNPSKPHVISRRSDLGDSVMTAIAITPLEEVDSKITARRFTDLGRLRLQETERVVALRTELTKCGAKVVEEGDTLTVYPSELHGAEIETYNDHRMAMCFAILGLKVPGIRIKNPACVKKTFPNFFQKLATEPPKGLGAEIWEVKNGQRTRRLPVEELFAD